MPDPMKKKVPDFFQDGKKRAGSRSTVQTKEPPPEKPQSRSMSKGQSKKIENLLHTLVGVKKHNEKVIGKSSTKK